MGKTNRLENCVRALSVVYGALYFLCSGVRERKNFFSVKCG